MPKTIWDEDLPMAAPGNEPYPEGKYVYFQIRVERGPILLLAEGEQDGQPVRLVGQIEAEQLLELAQCAGKLARSICGPHDA